MQVLKHAPAAPARLDERCRCFSMLGHGQLHWYVFSYFTEWPPVVLHVYCCGTFDSCTGQCLPGVLQACCCSWLM